MSVLVKGFKILIPDEPKTFLTHFNDDGTAEMVALGYPQKKYSLIEVPPHGRLVDESWLKKAMITTLEVLKKNPKMDGQEMHLIAAFDTLRAMIEDAPTIIEAEAET